MRTLDFVSRLPYGVVNTQYKGFNSTVEYCISCLYSHLLLTWLIHDLNMPLVRSPSAGNSLNLRIDSDIEEVVTPEAGRNTESVTSGVRTRQQAQREAAMNRQARDEQQRVDTHRDDPHTDETHGEDTHSDDPHRDDTSSDQHILQVVERSLETFRNEMSDTIGRELRNAMSNLNMTSGYGSSGASNNEGTNSYVRQRAAQGRLSVPAISDNITTSTEKIANLINNWHITFKGSLGDVPIEDFIYRVRTLVSLHLNGNFELLCQHAHILFDGKAKQWFWRFHRQTQGTFSWRDLCEASRKQFRDILTDSDIMDDIRRRRQRNNENFEDFLDILIGMGDRLQTPLNEHEFVEIVIRNLRNELRYELLHVNIPNISVLRSEVRKHERFNEEMRQWSNRNSLIHRKQVSEVEVEVEDDVDEDINALNLSELRCWNCEAIGHGYQICLAPRRIFCYGCGRLDSYKPTCPNCLSKSKSLNSKKDVSPPRDSHPHQKFRK